MNPYLALKHSPLILAYRQWEAGWALVQMPAHEAPWEIAVASGPSTEIPIHKEHVPLYLSPDGLACWHPETTGGKLYVRKKGNGVWEYTLFRPDSLATAKQFVATGFLSTYFKEEDNANT
jgi:hypothetical protein